MNKKQKQNRNILVGIAIIVGAIILINIGGGGKFLAVEQGFSLLSQSDVDVVGEGKKIVITGVMNGAEDLEVTFNPDELNLKLQDSGYMATKPAILSLTMSNPSIDFLTINDGQTRPFYSLGYYTRVFPASCTGGGNPPVGTQFVKRSSPTTCLYRWSEKYDVRFSGVSVQNTETTVKLNGEILKTSDGRTSIKPSEDMNILKSTDGKVEVKWQGYLTGIKDISSPKGAFSLLYNGVKFTKLIDDGSFAGIMGINEKGGLYENALTCTSSLFYKGKLQLNDKKCIDGYINDLNVALTDQKTLYEDSINSKVSFLEGKMRIDLDTPTRFPMFTITLDAEKVGLIKLSGKPEIIDSSCVDGNILSSQTFTNSIKVKNAGNNKGKFNANVNCAGIVRSFGGQLVDKGVTTDLFFDISGESSSGTQEKNCIITVTDENSGDSDTCDFTLSVKKGENIVCVPSSVSCISSTSLRTCNSDGSKFTDTKCDYGCAVLESGESQCKSSSQTCNKNSDCKTGEECSGGLCQQTTQCISEGQTFSKDQECCGVLEKKKTGFFLFRFLKSEGTCEIKLPKCADADALAKSKILGGIFPKLKCDGNLLQKLNPLPYIKLALVPIIFLFELLFTPAMIGRYFKRGKGFAWLIGLVLAGIVAYVFYTSWVMGLIFIGILLFFQITMGVISLFKRR